MLKEDRLGRELRRCGACRCERFPPYSLTQSRSNSLPASSWRPSVALPLSTRSNCSRTTTTRDGRSCSLQKAPPPGTLFTSTRTIVFTHRSLHLFCHSFGRPIESFQDLFSVNLKRRTNSLVANWVLIPFPRSTMTCYTEIAPTNAFTQFLSGKEIETAQPTKACSTAKTRWSSITRKILRHVCANKRLFSFSPARNLTIHRALVNSSAPIFLWLPLSQRTKYEPFK